MSDSRHAATVLVTSTPALFTEACARAADRLRKGELVALPTETVYGLAANALDPLAVERIYAAKGRPRRNPIIVHVASLELARECVATWPPEAEAFARAFWPGPLTLVLPRSARIPDVVTAGGDTVGIRWPNHPIIQSVLERCGFPLAAPSANPANRLSPTTARHVARELGNRIPLIIDGGRCQVGIESTVVDLTRRPALVLRPGMISLAALQAIAPTVELAENPAGGQLRSPGLLPKHYAPRGRLMLVRWADDRQLSRQISALGSSPCSLPDNRVRPCPAGGRGGAGGRRAERSGSIRAGALRGTAPVRRGTSGSHPSGGTSRGPGLAGDPGSLKKGLRVNRGGPVQIN